MKMKMKIPKVLLNTLKRFKVIFKTTFLKRTIYKKIMRFAMLNKVLIYQIQYCLLIK